MTKDEALACLTDYKFWLEERRDYHAQRGHALEAREYRMLINNQNRAIELVRQIEVLDLPL